MELKTLPPLEFTDDRLKRLWGRMDADITDTMRVIDAACRVRGKVNAAQRQRHKAKNAFQAAALEAISALAFATIDQEHAKEQRISHVRPEENGHPTQ